MKRFLVILSLFILHHLLSLSPGRAQVADAFKGVWPVTDKAMMKSLNGEWKLKVVKGIGGDNSVPAADASWRTIPVPGCWETYGFCKQPGLIHRSGVIYRSPSFVPASC